MNTAGLSFGALPPISVPFRYFLTAPIFMMVCALLVLALGDNLWLSRWHPHTIMLTHGVTLGVITMIMMGAIFQILPVVGGVGVTRVRLVGSACHLLHTLGTGALMFSFYHHDTWLKIVAAICLSISFSIYLIAVALVLLKKLSQGETIFGIRLAIVALTVTVVLGLSLVSRSLGSNFLAHFPYLTNIHLLWGLGWICLLIIAVSFQVIPMFHVAPNFPKWLMKTLPSALFILLCLLFPFAQSSLMIYGLAGAILLLLTLYAFSLLQTLSRRKRKIPDSTIDFWQLAAGSLILITICYLIPRELYSPELIAQYPMLIGCAFLYFFVISVLLGMLLKIVPFLCYTHLQQYCLSNFSAMSLLPNMHDLISKKQGRKLFLIHLITGATLCLTVFWPTMSPLLAIGLLVEFGWLLYLIAKSYLCYQKTLSQMKNLPS